MRLNRPGKVKSLFPKNSRHRKPKSLKAEAVGDGAAFDSIAYRAYGKRGYAITAIDLYSRIGFAMMVSSKSARSSAQVLRGMEAFLSAPIQTILSDNGSEFEGEFARVAADKGITRFYTHPNCPQQNAVNERFNRTVREGFLETHEDWIDDLQQMNEAPADWLTGYNGFRPHRSLNMTTPAYPLLPFLKRPFRVRPYNHTYIQQIYSII